MAVGSKSEVVRPLHTWPNQLAAIGESMVEVPLC